MPNHWKQIQQGDEGAKRLQRRKLFDFLMNENTPLKAREKQVVITLGGKEMVASEFFINRGKIVIDILHDNTEQG